MNLQLNFSHFSQIYKNGYTLDVIFLLKLVEEEVDISILCKESLKLEALYQSIYRKGLVSKECKLTLEGKNVLKFLDEEHPLEELKKIVANEDDFSLWWKSYPGTDTFTHKGKTFAGTRSLRTKKDDCKIKLNKIIAEGEHTLEQLIQALEYEVHQKKETSVLSGANKLSYMQNSLTYLNQRTFEPFVELIKEGHKIIQTETNIGGTDI